MSLAPHTHSPLTIVIVGCGNASLSFQSALLSSKQDSTQVQLITISKESFCIRPELFFTYKFLFQEDKSALWSNHGKIAPTQLMNAHVESIDVEKKELHLQTSTLDKSLEVESRIIPYDICVLAVGGIPNWIHFSEEFIHESTRWLPSDLVRSVSPLVHEMMREYQNMMVLRNTEEIAYLEKWILDIGSHEQNAQREIVVVGSGALSLDFVSNLVHGYVQDVLRHLNEKPDAQLPKIRIITRSNTLGMPLLRDERACALVQRIASSEPYSQYITVNYEDEIETLQVVRDSEGEKFIDTVRTKSGETIHCLALVQATGVISNTKLCASSGLKVGTHGGILVNEHYECQSDTHHIPEHSLFAIGDAIEFPLTLPNHKEYTSIWKNWTSSREQAQECALHSVRPLLDGQSMTSSTHNLVFSQTLRLFELYVACLGNYETEESLDASYVMGENDAWLMKLQFFTERNSGETLYQLVGALVLGNNVKHYHIGCHLLELIKHRCRFSAETRDQLVSNIEKFNFAHCVKSLQHDQVFRERIPDIVAAKKFKNPLLKKKGKRTSTKDKKSGKSSTSATESDTVTKTIPE